MVLYFFSKLRPPNEYPEELLDDNMRMDYSRLKSLVVAPEGGLREHPGSVIRKLLTERCYDSKLYEAFGVTDAYRDAFASYLFYLGLITIGGEAFAATRFVIPNYVIEQMHFQSLRQILSDTAQLAVDVEKIREPMNKMAYEGDMVPFLTLLYHEVIRKLSNRDLIYASEKNMKFILLAWLSLTDIFYPFSEMEVIGGYSDLILTPTRRYFANSYSFLLELKYIKEAQATDDKVRTTFAAADEQLVRYQADQRITSMAGPKGWKAISVVFIGTQAVHVRELGQSEAIVMTAEDVVEEEE
jgi:hypothetical protein